MLNFFKKSYSNRIKNEIEMYRDDINVHDLPQIQAYWSHRYLIPIFRTIGYADIYNIYIQTLADLCKLKKRPIFCSIGSGNCNIENSVVKDLVSLGYENFIFECHDINEVMLKRGEAEAEQKGITNWIKFRVSDVNKWKVSVKYDAIIAVQCLHHFIKLEKVFDNIHFNLAEDGIFLTQDMVGRNGHQRWPETLRVIQEIWSDLDEHYKYNHRTQKVEHEFINRDFTGSTFEGIRSQDILALLVERFHFEIFIYWGGIIDPFISRAFGHNFNPKEEDSKKVIGKIQRINEDLLWLGSIKPTQIVATMRKNAPDRKYYLHGKPPFKCIRRI